MSHDEPSDPPADPAAGRRWVTPVEAARLLDTNRVQVHRLIEDWAFGDPTELPDFGRRRRAVRIPVERVRAFMERGERDYPPGDPRRKGKAEPSCPN